MSKQDVNINKIKEILEQNKRKSLYVPCPDTGELTKISNAYKNGNGEYVHVRYKDCNYQLNLRGDTVELVVYKEPLRVPTHVVADSELFSNDNFFEVEEVLSERCWQRDKNGVAVKKDGVKSSLYNLVMTMKRSILRSQKNFYNYALSNKWEYFCTYTFADKSIRNTTSLLAETWSSFVKFLQRKYNIDVTALGVYEEFKKGGYHMHALLGNVDLSLMPKRNNDTNEFMYTEFGNQRFICNDWKYGWSEVVCIKPDSHRLQIVNYMSKYMNKESPAPFGCKRYFRTRNLENSFNYIGFKSDDDINSIISQFGLKEKTYKKKNDKVTYYFATIGEDEINE